MPNWARLMALAAGVAVGQGLAGVTGRDSEHGGIVGIAAHNAVQYDDISRLDLAGRLCDIEESACDLVRHPASPSRRAASAS